MWEQRQSSTEYSFKKCLHWNWVLVAHTCLLSYLGGWDQENHGSRPAQAKKFHETPPQWKKTGHGGTCLFFQLQWEACNSKITVQVSLGKRWDSISKITRGKRAGGVAQAGEHLPSKHEAPSSNPNNPPKKYSTEIHKGDGVLPWLSEDCILLRTASIEGLCWGDFTGECWLRQPPNVPILRMKYYQFYFAPSLYSRDTTLNF
jgi:hypothetical protein